MELKPKSAPQRLLWAQFDALQMGSGWDESDVTKPQILLEDVFGDSHPGSTHLAGLMEQAKYGVVERGGGPAQILRKLTPSRKIDKKVNFFTPQLLKKYCFNVILISWT